MLEGFERWHPAGRDARIRGRPLEQDPVMAANSEAVEALRWKKFPVLNDGFVCLVDCMGDDSAVVQAARVSYGEGTKKVSDDRTLIRYLMRHRHTTPLEMAEIKFLIRCRWIAGGSGFGTAQPA